MTTTPNRDDAERELRRVEEIERKRALAVALDGLADEYLRASCDNLDARIAFYRLLSVLAGVQIPPERVR